MRLSWRPRAPSGKRPPLPRRQLLLPCWWSACGTARAKASRHPQRSSTAPRRACPVDQILWRRLVVSRVSPRTSTGSLCSHLWRGICGFSSRTTIGWPCGPRISSAIGRRSHCYKRSAACGSWASRGPTGWTPPTTRPRWRLLRSWAPSHLPSGLLRWVRSGLLRWRCWCEPCRNLWLSATSIRSLWLGFHSVVSRAAGRVVRVTCSIVTVGLSRVRHVLCIAKGGDTSH
mmetsp:Transcript_37290/g.95406  ORF Transcript_37290/g.95406 Transcript_37290/m.95406 type:complete len:230 (+) Transcript_37290:1178-1867(+)